jgi:hypothetical protein
MPRYQATASDKWYFQPLFFLKCLWSVFAFAVVVILILFATKVTDPFWGKVVGRSPGGFLISCLIFYLIAVAGTLLCYFGFFALFRPVLLIAICCDTVLVFILGFTFVGLYGTVSRREWYIGVVHDYWDVHKQDDTTWIQWFRDHVVGTDPLDDDDDIMNYCDERTEDVGSSILGCFIVWGLFHAIWLYYLFTGHVFEETREDYINADKAYEQE